MRKNSFRKENQGGFINDVDSNDEATEKPNRLRSEFLGGACESDGSDVDDTEGDLTVRRQAFKKLDLDECKALLRRDKEVERASAPGRHKDAYTQMKSYATVFRTVLDKEMSAVPSQNIPTRPSLPLHDA